MADELNNYTSSSVDWRKTLRQNNTRTYIVILLFFLIYLGVGLLVDMFLVSNQYPQVPIDDLFLMFLHLQLMPTATFIMLGIAALSLLITYSMYDTLMLLGTEYHEVTRKSNSLTEKQLYNVIEEMVIAAGLRYMPKIFIIKANYMNAFASGYSEKSAMVAITEGLMQKLNRDELQAVMAHELSHIRHMDIKLTLTASLLANLTIMALDIVFYGLVNTSGDEGRNKSRQSLATIIMILRYVLPILNVVLLLYLSRKRELMADAGAVELMRANQPLASALIKISDDHVANKEEYAEAYQDTPHEQVRREAYIFDPAQAGFSDLSSISDLFSTHPSLNRRLEALGLRKKK